jgi:hypothetical protein
MMTSNDFALFLVALLNGADEEPAADEEQTPSARVAAPSPDPANRLPASD